MDPLTKATGGGQESSNSALKAGEPWTVATGRAFLSNLNLQWAMWELKHLAVVAANPPRRLKKIAKGSSGAEAEDAAKMKGCFKVSLGNNS